MATVAYAVDESRLTERRTQVTAKADRGEAEILKPSRWASMVFAGTALLVLLGIVLQVAETATFEGGRFESMPARVANLLAFFTIQSNLLVGLTAAVLALSMASPPRWLSAVRLAALLDIAVTGIVFRLALADLHDLEGRAAAADFVLHALVPIVAVVGWVIYGPRGRISKSTIAWATVVPVAWLAGTLVRGAVIDWYPYPFVDVTDLGYLPVVVNVVLITALFVGLAFGARWLDSRLPTR